jgi:hypothetical protein
MLAFSIAEGLRRGCPSRWRQVVNKATHNMVDGRQKETGKGMGKIK